jgi:CheY-like chemotaxis protein
MNVETATTDYYQPAQWITAKDLRVLVVDDDACVLETVGEAVEDHYKVLKASSGAEALDIVQSMRPEIVITDQRMSPMTGLELLEKIMCISPRTRRLLMTGYADIETVIEGLNRDLLQRYLTKPWPPEMLLSMLREAAAMYLKDIDRFTIVSVAIAPLRERLLKHRLYGMLTDINALRTFVEYHCYAVWDFMSLLKCLQNKLTCTTLPWNSPDNMFAARMINEIVVAEETDVTMDGKGYASHCDLYIDAMTEIGAETDTLRRFIDLMREGMHWKQAAPRAGVPQAAVQFVSQTLEVCRDHPAYEVAAFFLLGRENLIPDMFRKIIDGIAAARGVSINAFRYYLERHIGIDEQEHGPASERMMRALCGGDDTRWRLVKRAAEEALMARIKLWDGIAVAIQARRSSLTGSSWFDRGDSQDLARTLALGHFVPSAPPSPSGW